MHTQHYIHSLHDALPIYTGTSGGGTSPVEKEEEMNSAVLLRHPNGSIAFWDGPHFILLTSTDQVAALAAANLVPNTGGTPQYMRSEDHTSELQSRQNIVC